MSERRWGGSVFPPNRVVLFSPITFNISLTVSEGHPLFISAHTKQHKERGREDLKANEADVESVKSTETVSSVVM